MQNRKALHNGATITKLNFSESFMIYGQLIDSAARFYLRGFYLKRLNST
jgi:hypothetical protein